MATWAEFEQQEPEFAAEVRDRFAVGRHCTMATLRKDGAPRISGTEVEFGDGAVHLGMMPGSMKARDLLDDPRLAIHGPTPDPPEGAGWPGEAKFSGSASQVDPPAGYPPGALRFHVDLTSVVLTALNSDASALRIRLWRPGRGIREMIR